MDCTGSIKGWLNINVYDFKLGLVSMIVCFF